jgi:hypothetical protein
VPAPCGYGGLGDGLVTFHEDSLAHAQSSTVIAMSGHMIVHDPHPMQADASVMCAGWYPLLLVIVLSSSRICFGHAATHISHPLHRLLLIVTFGMI